MTHDEMIGRLKVVSIILPNDLIDIKTDLVNIALQLEKERGAVEAKSDQQHFVSKRDSTSAKSKTGMGVDIVNYPELGDTFINYQEISPLEQWKRIAKMLKAQNLIVIRDGG